MSYAPNDLINNRTFPTESSTSTSTPSFNVNPEAKKRTSHKKKKPPENQGLPPRPPNAWILYRSAKSLELANSQSGSNQNQNQDQRQSQSQQFPSISSSSSTSSIPIPTKQQNLSKYIATLWASEDTHTRSQWYRLAEEKLRGHQERFPDYKYKPSVTEKSRLAREKRRVNVVRKSSGETKVGKERERERERSARRRSNSSVTAPVRVGVEVGVEGEEGENSTGNPGRNLSRIGNETREDPFRKNYQEEGDFDRHDDDEGRKIRGSPPEIHQLTHPTHQHHPNPPLFHQQSDHSESDFQNQFETSHHLFNRRDALVPVSSPPTFGMAGNAFGMEIEGSNRPSLALDDERNGNSDFLVSGLGAEVHDGILVEPLGSEVDEFKPLKDGSEDARNNDLFSRHSVTASFISDPFPSRSGNNQGMDWQRSRSLSRSTRSCSGSGSGSGNKVRNPRISFPYPISAPSHQSTHFQHQEDTRNSSSTIRSPKSPKSKSQASRPVRNPSSSNTNDSFQSFQRDFEKQFLRNRNSRFETGHLDSDLDSEWEASGRDRETRKGFSRSQGANATPNLGASGGKNNQRPRSNTLGYRSIGKHSIRNDQRVVSNEEETNGNLSGDTVSGVVGVGNATGIGNLGQSRINFFTRGNPFPTSLTLSHDHAQSFVGSDGMDLDFNQISDEHSRTGVVDHGQESEALRENSSPSSSSPAWGRRKRDEIPRNSNSFQDERKDGDRNQSKAENPNPNPNPNSSFNFNLPSSPSAFNLPTSNVGYDSIENLDWSCNWMNANSDHLGNSLGSNNGFDNLNSHTDSMVNLENETFFDDNDQDWKTFVAETPVYREGEVEPILEEEEGEGRRETDEKGGEERVIDRREESKEGTGKNKGKRKEELEEDREEEHQQEDESILSSHSIDPNLGVQSTDRYEGVSPRTTQKPIDQCHLSERDQKSFRIQESQIERRQESSETEKWDPDIIGWAENHLAQTANPEFSKGLHGKEAMNSIDERVMVESLLNHDPSLPSRQKVFHDDEDTSMEHLEEENVSSTSPRSRNLTFTSLSSRFENSQSLWRNWRPNQSDPMSASTEGGFNVPNNELSDLNFSSSMSFDLFTQNFENRPSRVGNGSMQTSNREGESSLVGREAGLTREDLEMATSLLRDNNITFSKPRERHSNVDPNQSFEERKMSSTRISKGENDSTFGLASASKDFNLSRPVPRPVKERHSTTPTSTLNATPARSDFKKRHSKTPSWSAGNETRINFSRPLPLALTSHPPPAPCLQQDVEISPRSSSIRPNLRPGSNRGLQLETTSSSASYSPFPPSASQIQVRSARQSKTRNQVPPPPPPPLQQEASIDDFSEEELLAAIERRRKLKAGKGASRESEIQVLGGG